jgi:hypothetical protein
MRRRIYQADHENFREVVRKFIAKEVSSGRKRLQILELCDWRDAFSTSLRKRERL